MDHFVGINHHAASSHKVEFRERLLVYVAILATIGVYWTGLQGPFLLDDLPNFSPLERWLDGRASIAEIVFGNSSGLLGRPLSMLSFWISAATGGLHPFPFKLGNLVVHLACGLVAWRLLSLTLLRDVNLRTHAGIIAVAVMAAWLLHPINVSTVLYAVQRMAQLSTLFVLASLLIFVRGRLNLASGRSSPASWQLFLIYPGLVLLGLLSKENAAVSPALCLVIELAYFQRGQMERSLVYKFFGLFLAVPTIAGAVLVAVAPDAFIGAYVDRDFTLIERLLTQPRVLFEYLGQMYWPRRAMLGVFSDDYVASTGILSPPSTLIAAVALIAISIAAVAFRKLSPSIFCGWFFFLISHAVESGFLPLELYFEHRNYLPAFGIALATAGLLDLARRNVAPRVGLQKAQTGVWILPIIAIACFAYITFQQSRTWRSMDAIVAQTLASRPDSMRANLQALTQSVAEGRWMDARSTLLKLQQSHHSEQRFIGLITSATIDCLRGVGGGEEALLQAGRFEPMKASLAVVQAYSGLSLASGQGKCGPGLTDEVIAGSIVDFLKRNTGQPATSKPVWLLRALAAELYSRSGRWDDARMQAELAWHPRVSDTAIASLLVRIYIKEGDKQAAQRTLDEVRRRVKPHEIVANTAIELDQEVVDSMAD